MRQATDIAFEQAAEHDDVDGGTPPSAERPRGRHAATVVHHHGRRRWLVIAAAVAAMGGVVAPPPGPGASADVKDAALPLSLASPSAISFLSSGAPTGSVVLASAPAHVAQSQPMAPTVITGLAANGIPNVALNAYRVAATRMANNDPSCGIDWSLLAGIGRVESDHGRFGGAVLNPDGTSTPRIIGPSLDGVQFAFIRDTDRGLRTATPSRTAPSARCSSSPPPGAPTA